MWASAASLRAHLSTGTLARLRAYAARHGHACWPRQHPAVAGPQSDGACITRPGLSAHVSSLRHGLRWARRMALWLIFNVPSTWRRFSGARAWRSLM
jgi:hypothetical protein